ncbi:GNAT family N-acetyltransferase [Streptomyces sp. N2-109]|uniref:GNAT family N-acetyltransferase n=1 Tax=Streptomyces gossypii TaxID=2883101 RepID=A0ABT2JNU5_9ACTN|nr:GNAT family N-acetyltransferase [Streptomyces gossypii]MCT2589547.1 GNAT family N-acetyltransferase [Streptomyces gossypii]
MTALDITVASADDLRLLADWAAAEGWNPGDTDRHAFFATDPQGFLIGRLNGEPAACVSVVRYGNDFGFLGFYLTRPPLRGKGYGRQLWRAGMSRLAGRNIGLDGVVAQQANYRTCGFRSVWTNVRYEGNPTGHPVPPPPGLTLTDARALPFTQLAAYDRRFFPTARDSFLASWITAPQRTALAALQDGELCGLAVLREARTSSRLGPLYAATPEIAATLIHTLAATAPSTPMAIDVPHLNPHAAHLMSRLGLTPTFETARMYTGPTPTTDHPSLYGITSLELG